jgi:hypothetical protein
VTVSHPPLNSQCSLGRSIGVRLVGTDRKLDGDHHAAARAERDSHIRITRGFGRAMGLRDREILTDW